jgi:phosphonate transport system substrate-binding protein
MKRRTWAAAALAVSLLATACGGDTTDTEDEDPAATGTATEPATDDDGADDEAAAGDRADWPEQLVVGFVPSREADVLVENADDLGAALSDALGIPVETFVAQDYTALTEAMASGEADLGAFGPLGVVRAIDRADAEFILQSSRFGSFTYHTQYMTSDPDTYCTDEPQADEDGFLYCNGTLDAEEGPAGEDAIARIGEGTSLAFVDPTSASGYLIPALQMMEQGVDLDAISSTFAGGHDASVIAVLNGDVEVGLSFDDARTTVAEEFPEVGEQAVVFAYSEEIPNDGIVIRGDLPDSLKQAVVDELLAYAETDEGQAVLESIYEITGLREADPADLDVIRRADEELGDTFEG